MPGLIVHTWCCICTEQLLPRRDFEYEFISVICKTDFFAHSRGRKLWKRTHLHVYTLLKWAHVVWSTGFLEWKTFFELDSFFFFFLVGLILLLLNNVKTPMQHVNFLDWIVLNCFCPEKKEKKSCIWKWAAPTERCVSFTNWCHIERQRLNVCNKDQKINKKFNKFWILPKPLARNIPTFYLNETNNWWQHCLGGLLANHILKINNLKKIAILEKVKYLHDRHIFFFNLFNIHLKQLQHYRKRHLD